MYTTLYTQVSSIHVNVTEYSIYYISPSAHDVMWKTLINIAEEWDWSIVVWLVSWCSSWCVQPRCSALLFVPRLHSHCHQITPRLRKLHVIRVGHVSVVVIDCAQISESVDSVNKRHLFCTTCVAMLRVTQLLVSFHCHPFMRTVNTYVYAFAISRAIFWVYSPYVTV